MAVQAIPGFDLQPSSQQVPVSTNYLASADFTWLQQYLPDTYEKEFERYGNRTVASFLRMVGAEMPSNSDLIKWAEQGRLHNKYTGLTFAGATVGNADHIFIIPAGDFDPALAAPNLAALRAGQTVMLSSSVAGSTISAKGIITLAPAGTGAAARTCTVGAYDAGGLPVFASGSVDCFVYGSEFAKGTAGMVGSNEADDFIFDNKPIIIKDTYEVSGSDMAQIGWIEVTTENGATGYLWYLKSEHETRLRFEDYLETAMIEAEPAGAASGAGDYLQSTVAGASVAGKSGSEGIFYVVNNRGNVFGGGNPTTLAQFDSVIQRLDKQGSIEENVIFVNRNFSFDIDDMLAAQNSYGAGGTSYGLFDNDKEMALNLGFTGSFYERWYCWWSSKWTFSPCWFNYSIRSNLRKEC